MILITGATGHTGQFLLEELAARDDAPAIRCLVRKDSKNLNKVRQFNVELVYGDIEDEACLRNAVNGVDTVIHLVNIRYSLDVVRIAEELGVKRVMLVHTAGIYSKYRAYAKDYLDIENSIITNCRISYVILRPTMIYGSTMDHNMHKLIIYMSKHRIFPIFGKGEALMQPVHARDLAKAIVLTLYNSSIVNQAYDISGGTIMRYREILHLIADKLGTKIWFVHIPFSLALVFGALGNILFRIAGRKFPVSLEQIRRINENKSFSHEKASRELGYKPISFYEGIEEEIKSMGY